MTMTTDQLRNVILEAVDCLRQRKCRPDRESIAVYVMRKLGSSMNEIFSEIENIVDQGHLLKVEYKGSTSYRSPKNFDIKNSPLLTKHSKILNSSKTTRYVISGINELLSTFPSYNQEGIPYEELKKKLTEFDQERFAETSFKVIFEREEGAGNLHVAQCDDKLYPVRIFPKDISVPSDMKLISFSEDANLPPERKKRKRTKKDDADAEGIKSETSNGTSQIGSDKLDEKQDLVYAVKSAPDKYMVAKSHEQEAENAKVQQLSSIGLKVVTGKKAYSTPKKAVKVKNVKKKLIAETATSACEFAVKKEVLSDDEHLEEQDRKPCLTLISHEVATNSDVNVNGIPADEENKSLTVVNSGSETNALQKKLGKRKNNASDVHDGQQNLNKGKRQKLKNTEEEVEDNPVVSQIPPRFTYSSKRRANSYAVAKTSLAPSNVEKDENETHSNGQLVDVDKCLYCHQETNGVGDTEDFLSCASCSSQIHPTCIDYSEEKARRLRMNSSSIESHLQWQCFSCKRCGVCQKALMSSKSGPEIAAKDKKKRENRKKEQRYILCDQCDRGYHIECINEAPPVDESSWYCSECRTVSLNSEISSSNSTSTQKLVRQPRSPVKKRAKATKNKGRQLSPRNNTKSNNANDTSTNSACAEESTVSDCSTNETNDNADIPDISTWTPTQVQQYFVEKGLNDEAASLKEQEIDGMSLLLLRRADIIFGLSLRLGPALKIYRLVCQLQQHSSALKKKRDNSGDNSISQSVTVG